MSRAANISQGDVKEQFSLLAPPPYTHILERWREHTVERQTESISKKEHTHTHSREREHPPTQERTHTHTYTNSSEREREKERTHTHTRERESQHTRERVCAYIRSLSLMFSFTCHKHAFTQKRLMIEDSRWKLRSSWFHKYIDCHMLRTFRTPGIVWHRPPSLFLSFSLSFVRVFFLL